MAEKEANVVFIAKEQAEKNVFLARGKEANVVVCVLGQEWIPVEKPVSFAKAEECKDVRCAKVVARSGVPCAEAGE